MNVMLTTLNGNINMYQVKHSSYDILYKLFCYDMLSIFRLGQRSVESEETLNILLLCYNFSIVFCNIDGTRESVLCPWVHVIQ
jgi:hypothetical protein